jgi:hypothetical protein
MNWWKRELGTYLINAYMSPREKIRTWHDLSAVDSQDQQRIRISRDGKQNSGSFEVSMIVFSASP